MIVQFNVLGTLMKHWISYNVNDWLDYHNTSSRVDVMKHIQDQTIKLVTILIHSSCCHGTTSTFEQETICCFFVFQDIGLYPKRVMYISSNKTSSHGTTSPVLVTICIEFLFTIGQ